MTDFHSVRPFQPIPSQLQQGGQATAALNAAPGYGPAVADRHDEVYEPGGAVRPHWRYLLEGLAALGPEVLAERERKARRILRDDGATYNVSSEPLASRIWELDLVPQLIESEDWSHIEAGLIERAELLDLVLKDIYGGRDLIRHGIVPPELVYSHPGFLRQCQGIRVPGEHHLILYAADMVRDADGAMCIIGDRAQAPSGVGYALENRTVMSRVLPSLFRDSHVHRLSGFFHQLRQKLMALAPGDAIPQVAVLTPGSYSETYFEHAFLANYLGYPLVQGGDLTVRGGRVWMKSLEGLRRIDIILRRVDDFFCDPVELRGDSQLGVPGLLEVVRAGRVVIANPLGAGFVENPALFKYLPAIGKFFFGREPRIRTVETFWCGDPADRERVLAELPQLVIKPAFRRYGQHSVFGSDLGTAELALWQRRIQDAPLDYVAQRYQVSSRTPVLEGGAFTPRPMVLRSFAVANPTSYTVLPGGLTRIGRASDTRVITNLTGSNSKDTWVLASEPEKQLSLRREAVATRAPPERGVLPSRVVENLFWMGRYAERGEAALRLLRTLFLQLNGVEPLSDGARRVLLGAVTRVTHTLPGFTVADAPFATPERELKAVVLDAASPGSVVGSLRAMLQAGEEVKELLSADTQRVLNDLRDELAALAEQLGAEQLVAPEEALDPLVTSLLALAGLRHESMFRGMNWRFWELGRCIEKAIQLTTLLRATLVPDLAENDIPVVVESVLLTCETLITYRRRYRAEPDIRHGLELLVLDETNPRALLYQVQRLGGHIAALPAVESGPGLSRAGRLALEALTALHLSRPEELAVGAGEAGRGALEELLGRLEGLLIATAEMLAECYFDHRAAQQQLIAADWGYGQ
ncbi:MAG: circularly permuted type 2 ATP-grasp protein [Porticoccaceae bacterium]